MKKLRFVAILIVLCHVMPALADESNKSKEWTSEDIRLALLFEPMLATASYMAAWQPRVFGAFCVVAPLAGLYTPGPSKPSDYVMIASFETVAAYNLTVDTAQTGKQEIARNNFLALNALFALTGLASLADKPKNVTKTSLNYVPTNQGGILLVSGNF